MSRRNKRNLVKLKKIIWFIFISEKVYLSEILGRSLIKVRTKFFKGKIYEFGFFSFCLFFLIYYYFRHFRIQLIPSKDFGLLILSIPVTVGLLKHLNTIIYIIFLKIKRDKRIKQKILNEKLKE